MPDFGIKFDLITAYSICFNNHFNPDLWTKKEWEFFLMDLANNHCNKDCQALFVLNAEQNGLYYSDDLLQYFLQKGAKIKKARVYFKNLYSFRY